MQVCNRYEIENVVCPLKLKNKIFTTGVIDNIDHNPSCRDAKDSFHGTAISLTQHPTDNCPRIDRDVAVLDPSDIRPKELLQLPEDDVNVPAVTFRTQTLNVPNPICDLVPDLSPLHESSLNDYSC